MLAAWATAGGPGANGGEAPESPATESSKPEAKETEAKPDPPKEAEEIGESTDTVQQTLQDSATWRPGLIGNNVAENIHRSWTNSIGRLDRKTGIRLSFDYNSLVQYASASRDIDYGSSGEFRATARWNPWRRQTENPGFVDFQVRYRHRYSEIPPSDLGGQIGSLWPTTRGFNAVGLEVSHAYYEQYLFSQRLGFRVGQSRIDNMFDVHALRNQRLFFLNSAFSANPAVADPGFALLAVMMARPAKNVKLNLGITDANSQQIPDDSGSGFRLEDYYATAQVGWRPKLTSHGNTLLQAMYWNREKSRDKPAAHGLSLLAQQRWPDKVTTFLRYSYSTGVSAASRFVATGVGFTPLAKRRTDMIGAAFGWGRPTDRRLRDQYAVELFYRLQLTTSIELTPDIQFIIQPSLNPHHDVIAVFGVRARLTF